MALDDIILNEINDGNNFFSIKEISEKNNIAMVTAIRVINRLIDQNKIYKINNGYFTNNQLKNNQLLENELIRSFIKHRNTTNFKYITTSENLISYLRDTKRRLARSTGIDHYIYHYTNISAIVGIIKSKFWYLSNPLNMNDGLEYNHGSTQVWQNIFFSSFMTDVKESIAMWSMYAQPWEKGVMIAIPVNKFKKWIDDIDRIYSADTETKKPILDKSINRTDVDLFITSVAYCNTDNISEDGIEITTCGNAKNAILSNVANDKKLIGYVKNEAWAYEKEIRLRVDLKKGYKFNAIALPVTEELIDSMIITKGPRFDGNLINNIEDEIRKVSKIKDSLFNGKFRNIPCDSCIKQNNNLTMSR